MAIGKTGTWCAKYYSNTFKKHLYPENLTEQDKQMLQDYIDKMVNMRVDKGDIVNACKDMMKYKKVFINRVESFAHQYFSICMKRLSED